MVQPLTHLPAVLLLCLGWFLIRRLALISNGWNLTSLTRPTRDCWSSLCRGKFDPQLQRFVCNCFSPSRVCSNPNHRRSTRPNPNQRRSTRPISNQRRSVRPIQQLAASSSLIALSRMVPDKEIGSDSQQMEFNLPDATYP